MRSNIFFGSTKNIFIKKNIDIDVPKGLFGKMFINDNKF